MFLSFSDCELTWIKQARHDEGPLPRISDGEFGHFPQVNVQLLATTRGLALAPWLKRTQLPLSPGIRSLARFCCWVLLNPLRGFGNASLGHPKKENQSKSHAPAGKTQRSSQLPGLSLGRQPLGFCRQLSLCPLGNSARIKTAHDIFKRPGSLPSEHRTHAHQPARSHRHTQIKAFTSTHLQNISPKHDFGFPLGFPFNQPLNLLVLRRE